MKVNRSTTIHYGLWSARSSTSFRMAHFLSYTRASMSLMNSDLENAVAVVAEYCGRVMRAVPDDALVERMDLVQLMRRQLDAMELVVVQELERRDLARKDGARSLSGWLQSRHRITAKAANRKVRLARALDTTLRLTRNALRDGTVTAEQAWVIAEALKTLPDQLDPPTVRKAEAALVKHAELVDATGLRVFGARILHHLEPEMAAEHDRQRLAAQRQNAREKRRLKFTSDGNGAVRFNGVLDQQTAAKVQATITRFAKPVPHTPDGATDERSAAQRCVDAFAEVCELARASEKTREPDPARPPVVAVDYERTTRELGIGTVDTGKRLPPEVVRRLAGETSEILGLPDSCGLPGQSLGLDCESLLVAGADSPPLTKPNRGCAALSCDRPPRWCDTHRRTPWMMSGNAYAGKGLLLPVARTLSVAQVAA